MTPPPRRSRTPTPPDEIAFRQRLYAAKPPAPPEDRRLPPATGTVLEPKRRWWHALFALFR